MFGENVSKNTISKSKSKSSVDLNIYNYAKHCRENENLCGKTAIFYEKKEVLDNTSELMDKIEKLKLRNKILYDYSIYIKNNEKNL